MMTDQPNDAMSAVKEAGLLDLVQPPVRKVKKPESSIQVELSEKILLPLLVLLLLLVSFLMVQVGGLSDTASGANTSAKAAIAATDKNRETGYVNRSVSCTIDVAVVGKAYTPVACFDANVLKYYNPDKIPVSNKQAYLIGLVCEFIHPNDTAALLKCTREAG